MSIFFIGIIFMFCISIIAYPYFIRAYTYMLNDISNVAKKVAESNKTEK